MSILVLLVAGVVYTAFVALVFAVLTLLLGKMFQSFEVSGPDDWKFLDFYKRYLVIAAVYVFVSMPLGNGLIGIAALATAYKFVFDAGWPQAAVMGTIGGVIALALFMLMMFGILGALGTPRRRLSTSPGKFQLTASFASFTRFSTVNP